MRIRKIELEDEMERDEEESEDDEEEDIIEEGEEYEDVLQEEEEYEYQLPDDGDDTEYILALKCDICWQNFNDFSDN